ncbi:hypothetical protein VLK31_09070 [Variovorax sp. H27-G14]|uniref:hypothetical protein n=1 Tax=Variovorax sp. H27-G14 TaxID=3111914 RepID=UPI0038FCEA03
MNIREIEIRIAKSVIASLVLPSKIFEDGFDDFLFFDADLSSDCEFLEEIERAYKLAFQEIDAGVIFLYASNFASLANIERQASWAPGIGKMRSAMEAGNLHGGVILADENLSWIAVQFSPVELGVLAVNLKKKNAFKFIRQLDRNWFFSISDATAAVIDVDLPLNRALGSVFLEQLVANYSTSNAG